MSRTENVPMFMWFFASERAITLMAGKVLASRSGAIDHAISVVS